MEQLQRQTAMPRAQQHQTKKSRVRVFQEPFFFEQDQRTHITPTTNNRTPWVGAHSLRATDLVTLDLV